MKWPVAPLLLVSLLLSGQLEVSAVNEHLKDIQLTSIDRDALETQIEVLIVGETFTFPTFMPVTTKGKTTMRKIRWRNQLDEIVSKQLTPIVPSTQHFTGQVDGTSYHVVLKLEVLSKQAASEAKIVKKQLEQISVLRRLSAEQVITAKEIIARYNKLSDAQQQLIEEQPTIVSLEKAIATAEETQTLKKEALSLIVSPTVEVGYDVTKEQLIEVLTDVLQARVSANYYVRLSDTVISDQAIFATATLISTMTQQRQRVPVKMTVRRTMEKQETLNVARQKEKYDTQIAGYMKAAPNETLFQQMQRRTYETSSEYEHASVEAARAYTALERLEAYQLDKIILKGPTSRIDRQLRQFLDSEGDTDITYKLRYVNQNRHYYTLGYEATVGMIRRDIVVYTK